MIQLIGIDKTYFRSADAEVRALAGLEIGPGDEVYEGQIVGIHSRDNDLTVNPMKAKQLTNIRAAGSDENILLTPPIRMSLEQALEFIDDDELVEVTPKGIRLLDAGITDFMMFGCKNQIKFLLSLMKKYQKIVYFG